MFFSKCKMARYILGWIIMKYLIEDELDYEDLVLVNALKDVFDFEIEEFTKFAQEPDNGPDKEIGTGLVFINDYNESCRIFITKFINAGIFGNDLAGNRLSGDGKFPLKYVKTSVTNRLLEYIKIFSTKNSANICLRSFLLGKIVFFSLAFLWFFVTFLELFAFF